MGKRGRPRIWNKLLALSCQHRIWCGAWAHEPWDRDLSQSPICHPDWATQMSLLNFLKKNFGNFLYICLIVVKPASLLYILYSPVEVFWFCVCAHTQSWIFFHCNLTFALAISALFFCCILIYIGWKTIVFQCIKSLLRIACLHPGLPKLGMMIVSD